MEQTSNTNNDINALIKSPLKYYIKKNKRAFSIGMFFLLLTNSLDGLYPLILKRAIDEITAGVSAASILKTSGLFFLVLGLLSATRFLWRIFFGKYHTLAAEDLRNKTFTHLTTMGPQFFQKNPVGELISLIANDIQSFRQAIGSGVLILVDGISLILILLPIMFYLNWEWTLKALILLPTVPFLIWFLTKMIFSRYKKQQDELAHISGFSQEIVSGIRVIKSYAHESLRSKLYENLNRQYERTCNRVSHVDAMFSPIMQFGVASGTVILIFIAANDLVSGVATAGTFVAFQRYITKMAWPLTALGFGVSQFQKGMASFERIKTKLIESTDIPDNGRLIVDKFESLEVDRLTFTYQGSTTPALRDVSFKVLRGETFGITGAVGSGKSTLVNVIARLLPTQNQCVRVNGIPYDDIQQETLRSVIVLVPQDTFLFSVSVNQNVTYGKPLEREVVWNLIDTVDLTDEVRDLPQGLDSQLGERGVNLSGGQKQRLTLARGFAIESPLLIIDDALSAVDIKTEEAIERAILNRFGSNVTKIIVSHRVSTLMKADRVLVLEQGKVEALGTPDELLQVSKVFKELKAIQQEHHNVSHGALT